MAKLKTRNISEYMCIVCGQRFTTRGNLKRHKRMHTSPVSLECFKCGKNFARKDTLRRHLYIMHTDASPEFECAHCSKKFRYRDSVASHIISMHFPNLRNLEKEQKFECAFCGKKTNRKHCLKRHIQARHLTEKESSTAPKNSRFICLVCKDVFLYSSILNEHYTKAHNIDLSVENLEFNSFEQFEMWKLDMERRTITQFVKWYGHSASSQRNYRFVCHRFRIYNSRVNEDERKRCLKLNGYKGLGGFCPAEIKVSISADGVCRVKYQKTHVGHRINDEMELKHMFLSKQEKLDIVAKIRRGMSKSQILKEQLARNNESSNRLSILSRQDVENIAASHRVVFENREPVQRDYNGVSTEALIAQHEDEILFHKSPEEEDQTFNVLCKEDFVLVIMDKFQEEILRRYGPKFVGLENTPGTEPCEFLLYTLLVADVDGAALPAAFLLTNRNDRNVIDVFVSCVYRRIGVIASSTLLTDVQLDFYNSWIKLMPTPQWFLFCPWHVREAWRTNRNRIVGDEKKRATLKQLYNLAQELDPVIFEEKLNAFLSNDDEDIEKFVEYFKQTFLKHTYSWAHCYRISTGFNTNRLLEVFHQVFKQSIAGGQQITSVHQCLVYIFDYLTSKKQQMMQKQIKGILSSKLATLRSRHRDAYNYYKSNDNQVDIITINECTFLVCSFTENIYHTIYKNEFKECDNAGSSTCNLVCASCRACVHDFHCSCHDSSVISNMCKHIHLLKLYQKNLVTEVLKPDASIQDLELNNQVLEIIEPDTSTQELELNNQILEIIEADISTQEPERNIEPDTNVQEPKRNEENKSMQQWLEDVNNVLEKIAFGWDDVPAATAEERDFIFQTCIKPIIPMFLAHRSSNT